LVTEAHRCEQLAQGCYTAFATGSNLNPRPVDCKSNALLIAVYPLINPPVFDLCFLIYTGMTVFRLSNS